MLKFLRIMRLMRTVFFFFFGGGGENRETCSIEDATVDVTSCVGSKGLRP